MVFVDLTAAFALLVAAIPAEAPEDAFAEAVVSQRLTFRAELGMRVPECEILRATTAAKSLIRRGQYFKLPQIIETQRSEGMWSFRRYQEWLDERVDWHTELDGEPDLPAGEELPPFPDLGGISDPLPLPSRRSSRRRSASRKGAATGMGDDGPAGAEDVIEIEPPDESIGDILRGFLSVGAAT